MASDLITTPSGEIAFHCAGGGVRIYVANARGELRNYERLTSEQWQTIVEAVAAEMAEGAKAKP